MNKLFNCLVMTCVIIVTVILGFSFFEFFEVLNYGTKAPSSFEFKRLSNNDSFIEFTRILSDGTKAPYSTRSTNIVDSVGIVESSIPFFAGKTRITYNKMRRVIIVEDSYESVIAKLREG